MKSLLCIILLYKSFAIGAEFDSDDDLKALEVAPELLENFNEQLRQRNNEARDDLMQLQQEEEDLEEINDRDEQKIEQLSIDAQQAERNLVNARIAYNCSLGQCYEKLETTLKDRLNKLESLKYYQQEILKRQNKEETYKYCIKDMQDQLKESQHKVKVATKYIAMVGIIGLYFTYKITFCS